MTEISLKELEDLCHSLGLHEWDMGDDGFGGEWVVYSGKLERLKKWFEDRGVTIKLFKVGI